jgi:hypothetical protein
VASRLRQLVAAEVAGDHLTFNEAFLGKDNTEYQRWIKSPDKWGGAIELFILSRCVVLVCCSKQSLFCCQCLRGYAWDV